MIHWQQPHHSPLDRTSTDVFALLFKVRSVQVVHKLFAALLFPYNIGICLLYYRFRPLSPNFSGALLLLSSIFSLDRSLERGVDKPRL